MSERIPTVRASLRGGVRRIKREEPTHRGIVAEDCGCVDIAARDLGVSGQNCLGTLECPGGVPAVERSARGLDEGRQWIVCVGHVDSPYGYGSAPETFPVRVRDCQETTSDYLYLDL